MPLAPAPPRSQLHRSLHVLAAYDISSLRGRAPPLDPDPMVVEPSLSALTLARQEQAQRAQRFHLPASHPAAASTLASADQGGAGGAAPEAQAEATGSGPWHWAPAPHDAAWTKRLRQHAAYQRYAEDLLSALTAASTTAADQAAAKPPAGGGQRRQRGQEAAEQEGEAEAGAGAPWEPQLCYQIGVCEDWLQLSHLLGAFRGRAGAASLARACEQLTRVVTPRGMLQWGASERLAFSSFLAALAERLTALMQGTAGGSGAGSEAAADKRGHTAARRGGGVQPEHLGWVAYSFAALEAMQEGRMLHTLQLLPHVYSYGDLLVSPPAGGALSSAAAAAGGGGGEAAWPHERRVRAVHALFAALCLRAEASLRRQPARPEAQPRTARAPAAGAVDGPAQQLGGASRAALETAEVQEEEGEEEEDALPPVLHSADEAGGAEEAQGGAWRATQFAQLVWALGSLGFRPSERLLELLLR